MGTSRCMLGQALPPSLLLGRKLFFFFPVHNCFFFFFSFGEQKSRFFPILTICPLQ